MTQTLKLATKNEEKLFILIIIISLIESIIIEATIFMFRSLGKSKIALVLAILFGLSLFLMRGGERYSGLFGSDNVVASVSGTPISTSKFLRVMQMNVNQYSQMFGKPLTGEEIQAFQIHSMALGQLVNNAVFENEFDKQQFIVDETVVASETKNLEILAESYYLIGRTYFIEGQIMESVKYFGLRHRDLSDITKFRSESYIWLGKSLFSIGDQENGCLIMEDIIFSNSYLDNNTIIEEAKTLQDDKDCGLIID